MSRSNLRAHVILIAFAFLCYCMGESYAWKLDQRCRQTNNFESKRWLQKTSVLVIAVNFLTSNPSLAVDSTPSSSSGKTIIYKSGRNPVLPNPKEPKEGSKKDTNFLRALSNCKSNCQAPSEGLANRDCIQDCQDQCCTTYEQCSFKIKISSAGNSI